MLHNTFFFLCCRYQGIWDHIKNDEVLLKDIQCVNNVLKLSLLLSKALWAEGDDARCGRFLEDLSCSLFFKTVLPQFIQYNPSGLSK